MSRVSAATRKVPKAVSPVHVVGEMRSPDGRELFVGVERFQRDQVFAGRLLGAPLDRSLG